MSDKSSSTIDDVHALDQPVPRSVQLKGFQNALGLWSMSIFLILAMGLLYGYVLYDYAVPFWSSFYGAPAQAVVMEKYLTLSRTTSGCHLKLQYAQGSANSNVSWNTYYDVQVGQTLPVHYFNWAPGEISVDEDKPSGMEFWFDLAFQIAALLIATFLLKDTFNRIRRQKLLLINGKAARGRVTSGDRNNVKYEFEFEGGKWEGNKVGRIFFNDSEIGDDVLVLFDPNKPRTNMAYDDSRLFWEIVE